MRDLDDLLGEMVSQIKDQARRVDELERQPAMSLDEWIDYSATSTIVGWSAFATQKLYYKRAGKLVFVSFYLSGTSNATNATFTVPYAIDATIDGYHQTLSAQVIDNGIGQLYPGIIAISGSTVTIYRDTAFTLFTASGSKYCIGQFWYERA